jgi:hypothetical protein
MLDPGYAAFLTDDDAVVVLAHELTHMCARRNRLRNLIRGVSTNAKLAGVLVRGIVRRRIWSVTTWLPRF